jgi:hypothetical protein
MDENVCENNDERIYSDSDAIAPLLSSHLSLTVIFSCPVIENFI